MHEFCPVVGKRVDEVVVRIVAGVAVLTMFGALMTDGHVRTGILVALALDFVVRGFCNPRLSLVSRLAMQATRTLHLAPKPTDAGPKMFAAKIGAVTTFCILGAHLAGAGHVMFALAATLMVLASLEAGLSICVGCYMYIWLMNRKRSVTEQMQSMMPPRPSQHPLG